MAQIILDSNNNLIQGDFDNATLNNRTKLQTTTTNATTNVYVVPNGSSTSAGVSVANNSSLTNASKIVMATNGTTDTQIISGVNGSGTYLPLSFYTNNALAMQLSTGGSLGVGTSNPSPKITVARTATTSVTNASYYLGLGGTENLLDSKRLIGMGYSSGSTDEYPTAMGYVETDNGGYTKGAIAFYTRDVTTNTAPSERMRITSAGETSISNISAYQTPEGVFTVNGNGCGDYIGAISNRNLSNCGPAHGLIIRAGYNGSSSASNFFSFRRPDNTVLGAITQNGASNISYATSSDYRLKENIIPMTGALAKISALKPVTYTWKEDGSAGQGFIAHELQEVVPNAVVGEKDAVDEKGNPVYQGVDTSFLVATLTAAIQEQQNIIKDLTSRIEKLEEVK
jgi:hypothetical protein